MAKKRLIFKVPRGLNPLQLAEELKRAGQAQLMNIEVTSSKIIVRLYGDPVSIERSSDELKKVYGQVLERYKYVSRRYVVIPKKKIASVLGFPISLSIFKDVLKLKGIPFEEREDCVIVHDIYSRIAEIAKRAFDNYLTSKDMFTSAARRVASVISVVIDSDLSYIAQRGLSLGVFVLRDNKYHLAVNPEKAYAIFLESEEEHI